MTELQQLLRDYRLDCTERISLHMMVRDFEDFRAEWEREADQEATQWESHIKGIYSERQYA